MRKIKNLNLLFNKLYFSRIRVQEIEESGEKKYKIVSEGIDDSNKSLFSASFSQKEDYTELPIEGIEKFLLEVTYPGLLSGIGNPHDASDDDDALKVGFSFDYVSGLPCIPGSTVKGVLRGSFRNHPEAVAEVYNSLDLSEKVTLTPSRVKELESIIFEEGDIFFDAVVYWHDPDGKLVSNDTITPHGADETKNPVPVQILRINPGVKLEFRFKLNDKGISAQHKIKLFEELLKLFGIGAKTNVGYGRLKETDDSRPAPRKKPEFYPMGDNKRSGSKGGGYKGNNSPQKASKPVYIDCPNCKRGSYKYDRNGNLNTHCSRCKMPFPKGYNK